MSRPVSALRNIGPALAASFAKAGITTAEEIEALGPDAAFMELVGAGRHLHFMGYMALWLGLQDRDFRDIASEERERLRTHYDTLFETPERSELEQFLRDHGLGD
ncbi:MAG: TfoX/Sxy family DNA transformation protein [Pseudomonadota bacterium]